MQQPRANIGLNLGGRVGLIIEDLENMDPNKGIREEDSPMEIGKGNKRPRTAQFSPVPNQMDLGKIIGRQDSVHNFEISVSSTRQSSQMQ